MEGGSGGVNRVVEGSKYSRLWSLGEFAVHDPFKESRKLKEWYARKTNEKTNTNTIAFYIRQLDISIVKSDLEFARRKGERREGDGSVIYVNSVVAEEGKGNK